MVADILPVQGESERADPNAAALQRAQDAFLRNGFIALNFKIPDEKGTQKQRQATPYHAHHQSLTVAEAPEEKGDSLSSQHRQLALQTLCRPPQRGIISPRHTAGKGGAALPLEVPEGQIPGTAQVQHPFRKRALHPQAHLTPQAVSTPVICPPPPRHRFNPSANAPVLPPSWPAGLASLRLHAARRRRCWRQSGYRCKLKDLYDAPDTADGLQPVPAWAALPPRRPAGQKLRHAVQHPALLLSIPLHIALTSWHSYAKKEANLPALAHSLFW